MKLLSTLLAALLIGCSHPAPAAPTTPVAAAPDWTMISPTAWQPPAKELPLAPENGKVELFASSPVYNAHIAVVTTPLPPGMQDPNDFGVSQLMQAHELGYHVQGARSSPVGTVQGVYMVYIVDEAPDAIFYQLSVGHKDHAHNVVCAFSGEVSDPEIANCLGSIDTFRLN